MSEYIACPQCGQDMRLSPGAVDKLGDLKADLDRYKEALEEISQGKGRYSQDQFEHCQNTVADMKAIAKSALAQRREGNMKPGTRHQINKGAKK